MAHYNFKKQYTGKSDMAALVLVGYTEENGVTTSSLKFYHAYIVNGPVELGALYKKVASFKSWLEIYDGSELKFRAEGERIDVYRAGAHGCVIQVFEKEADELLKNINEELPDGVIAYYYGEREYKFTYSENSYSAAKQDDLKRAVKEFVEKHNGTITSHDNYYCIIARF